MKNIGFHKDALSQAFRNTMDAAIGIDKKMQIRFWNKACEKLFGKSFDEVKDKKCYSIIGGADLNGHLFCTHDCPLIMKLLNGEPVADYDLVIKRPDGDPVVVNVGAFVMPQGYREKTDIAAFLVFRKVSTHRLIKRLAAELRSPEMTGRLTKYNLTMRETEILELTAQGMKTPQIARHLSISEVTVRNHFKNIFSKLGVHSRAEAISLALRSGFF